MSWDVYFAEPAEQWILGLGDTDYEAILAAIDYSKSTVLRSAGRRPTGSKAHDTTT